MTKIAGQGVCFRRMGKRFFDSIKKTFTHPYTSLLHTSSNGDERRMKESQFLTGDVKPIMEKEVDSTDQQGYSGHNGVAKGGAKRYHEEEYTHLRRNAYRAFMLN